MADKWLTFDCYGTVADWTTCMSGALEAIAGLRGADAARLLAAYHQAELEIEAGPGWRSYREVLTAGLARAAGREHITLPRGGEDAFVRAWPDMPIFDDAGPALTALAGHGWRLAFLTNCDDDLFATTVPRIPAPVDLWVTAEEVHSEQRSPALQEVRRKDWGHQGELDSRGQQLGARHDARGPDGTAFGVGGPRPHRASGQARGPADHQHAQAPRRRSATVRAILPNQPDELRPDELGPDELRPRSSYGPDQLGPDELPGPMS